MPIHPTASVDPGAVLAADVTVGPYAVIEAEVAIGEGSEVRAHAVVKRYSVLGHGVRVHEHAVLGGEPQDVGFSGAPSRLVVGDRTVVREGVTLHRASLAGSETVVGPDCFLMANSHVAHDCRLGAGVILANGVLLAGHVAIGDRAFLSGNVVVHQFCRIGRLAMLGGGSKVIKDCLPFSITDGNPARARAVNLVGLRRAGFTAAQIRALREAYRLLIRQALPLEAALARAAELGDERVDELVAFCRGSRRGFHKGRRETDAAD